MAVANAGWMMASRVCSDALSLVLFGIIARQYGPAGLGIYATYFAVATILFDLVSLGIDDFSVREYTAARAADRRSLLQGLMRLQLLAAAAAIAGVAIFCIAESIDAQRLLALAFLVIYQLSNALTRTLLIPSLAEGSLARFALVNVASRLGIALVAATAVASPHAGLAATLSGFPIFGLAALAYTLRLQRHNFATRGLLRRSGKEWPMLRVLFPYAAADALTNLVVRIPIVVLFLSHGEIQTGLYATAYKLTELGWSVLLFVPLAAYAALIRAASADWQHLAAQADHVLRQTLVLGGLLAWGLYAVAPAIIVPLLGAKVAAARPLIEALAPYLLLQAVATYLLRLMLVFGRQALRLKILVSQTVATAVLCLALAPRFGGLGVIIGLTAGEALTVVLHFRAVEPRLPGTRLRHRLQSFATIVAVSIVLASAVRLLSGQPVAALAVALAAYLSGCAYTRLLTRDMLNKPSFGRSPKEICNTEI